ncbi:MAG: hypothetical protein IPP47_15625 [Bryobacterales bacterium]|nr:hypothetical protein [Bryobacterales bacterium]
MSAPFVLLILTTCLVSLYAGFRAVAWLFAELSGWHKLESRYACNPEPQLWTHRRETIRVNSIRFRRCADAALQDDALYLRVSAIFRFRPIRIPWAHVVTAQPDSVYGRPAMRLNISDAGIVVDLPLYTEIYPHLPCHGPHRASQA